VRLAVLLASVGVLVSACEPEPCVPPGQYELFARRGPTDLDGGLQHCPVELQASIQVRASNAADFTMDGGIEGHCVFSTTDYRPRYGCQVAMNCVASSGQTFNTFSLIGSERQDVIDGTWSPIGPRFALVWKSAGCMANYSWALAPRSQP
jgi:hypothetical protein